MNLAANSRLVSLEVSKLLSSLKKSKECLVSCSFNRLDSPSGSDITTL
jgi:hypothetical protein